jgi:hypothetical protein
MGHARWLSFGLGLGFLAGTHAAVGQSVLPLGSEIEPLSAPSGGEKPSHEDEAAEEAKRNVFLPLAMYTPETHVGFGGLFVHFFRPPAERADERVSSVALLVLATTRRQAIIELHPDFYFLSGDMHLFGKLEFQYYPDSFWGIGPRTPDEDEVRYARARFRAKGNAHYRLVGPLYGGLGFDVMDYHATYGPTGIFATEAIPGEEGGLTTGVGPTAVYDTRDNTAEAHSGTYLGAALLWFPPAVSDYDFHKVQLDARQFFDLGNEHAIGVHFYSEIEGGYVPYYHLALLGGDELLRGYYFGRYRDETLAALDTEWRYPIYWKFGGVLFAGAGVVGPTIRSLFDAPVRWSAGGGLRFSLSDADRLNLRVDAGFGPGTYGFYFTAREAF